MKFFDKLGLALFSMIVLIISIIICLIGFGILQPSIIGLLILQAFSTQTGTYITIGVCAFLSVLAFVCLFFGDASPKVNGESGIMLQNNDGKLLITKSTLGNIVEGLIKEFPSIISADTDVEIDKDNNVYMNVDLDIEEKTVIKDVTAKLQSKIKSRIKEDTDLDIKEVNVKIKRVEPKQKDEE